MTQSGEAATEVLTADDADNADNGLGSAPGSGAGFGGPAETIFGPKTTNQHRRDTTVCRASDSDSTLL